MRARALALVALAILLAGCSVASYDPGPGPGPGATQGPQVSQPGIWVADGWALGTALAEAAVAMDGDHAYLVGGFTDLGGGSAVVQSIRKDGTPGQLLAPYPMPVHHVQAAVVGDHLYVFGGFVTGVTNPAAGVAGPPGWPRTPLAFRYGLREPPQSTVWEPIARLPEARAGGGAVALDGKVLITGGVGLDGAYLSSTLLYDPATDSYDELAPLPTPRDHLNVVEVAGTAYTLGGRVLGSAWDDLDTVEAYDPATDTWSSRSPMPFPRGGQVAAVVNGRIAVFGGEVAEGTYAVLKDADLYDPASDTWLDLMDMPEPRHGGAAIAWGLELHYMGGALADGSLTDAGLRLRIR